MKPGITKVVLKRIVTSVILLFLLITFLFFLLRIAPGNPSEKYLSSKLSPLLYEKVKESFNTEGPLIKQYFVFLQNITTGNFGISYDHHKPVAEVIFQVLPFTVSFALAAFVLQFCTGLLLALLVFRYWQRWGERIITKLSFILFSTPVFVSGVLFLFIFSAKLGWLPASGEKSLYYDELGFFSKIIDIVQHMIMPVTCLALTGIPVYYKYMKDSFEEVNNKLFIKYLRANGIPERRILLKHILPNSINPVVAYAGIDLGMLLSSVLVTEVIFGLNGMGRLAVNAILSRDYPLITGCTITAGVMMIISNIIADYIRIKIDKRLLKGVMN